VSWSISELSNSHSADVPAPCATGHPLVGRAALGRRRRRGRAPLGLRPRPLREDWKEQLTVRGIEVQTDVLREEAIEVVRAYGQRSDTTVYNGRRPARAQAAQAEELLIGRLRRALSAVRACVRRPSAGKGRKAPSPFGFAPLALRRRSFASSLARGASAPDTSPAYGLHGQSVAAVRSHGWLHGCQVAADPSPLVVEGSAVSPHGARIALIASTAYLVAWWRPRPEP
jgi:hypothetical protein